MIEALRYKLRMFGIPIDGVANVYYDNEAVYKNTSIPESVLKKKLYSLAYQMFVMLSEKNLADLLGVVSLPFFKSLTIFLLERFTHHIMFCIIVFMPSKLFHYASFKQYSCIRVQKHYPITRII